MMAHNFSTRHEFRNRPVEHPARHRLARFALAVLLLLALLLLTYSAAHGAGFAAYTLGPQDKIRVKVVEWRANVDTVFEWSSLNGEFTVGASGAISLPLIGEVQSAGLTPSALSTEIGERLKKLVALASAPVAAVEVVQYRPFYILGTVAKPGEYAFRPDITVLQALSIAGGLTANADSGVRPAGDIIVRRGELREAETQTAALMAQKARLEAEAGNIDKMQFPAELEQRKNNATIAQLMQQERLLFDTRRNTFKAQTAALTQAKAAAEKEIAALEAQAKTQKTAEDRTRKDLTNIGSLVSKGLAAASRRDELQRTASRLEDERQRLDAALLRVRQEAGRADAAIADTTNKRTGEAVASLRETQALLEQAMTRHDTASKLVAELQTAAHAPNGRSTRAQPVYTIVRANEAQPQRREMSATELTRLEPGDTLKVESPLDDAPAATTATQ